MTVHSSTELGIKMP